MNEDKEILEIFSKLEDDDFENTSMQEQRMHEYERDRINKEKMAWVRSHKRRRR